MSANNKKKKRKNRNERRRELILRSVLIGVAAVCVIIILRFTACSGDSATGQVAGLDTVSNSDSGNNIDIEVNEMLLSVNEYSRPGTAIDAVNGIVVHYTANPGSTAAQNRSYFEGLKDGESGTYASSHFIIGLDGEIIQCVPLNEIAYASNDRNSDTISIECCHEDETGKFTDATYDSLVRLTAWLMEEFDLDETTLLRHYDVTGKDCPKYFVDNESAWERFKSDAAQMCKISESTAEGQI